MDHMRETNNGECMRKMWQDISIKELKKALLEALKWKFLGNVIENIQLNALVTLQKQLFECFSDIMKNAEKMTSWLTEGITYEFFENESKSEALQELQALQPRR